MPYNQYTQTQLVAAISLAMQDPQNLYWRVDEIQRAINEALLYWGALTSYWRERGAFQAVRGVPYYDLSVVLPNLRTRTITLDDLVRQTQYHLQEPANGISGAGMTSQFSVSQIINALTRARNQFVLDARLPFSMYTPFPLAWDQIQQPWVINSQAWAALGSAFQMISPPPAGRTALDPSVVALGHMSWVDGPSGAITPLRREDAWSEDSYNPLWTLEPNRPFAYSEAETRPVEIQFYPPPIASGALEVAFIQSITMDPTQAGSLFLVPDEFASAIKWYALYSLLSTQNEGYDPARAGYALSRYQQLIAISVIMRSVLRVQVNNVPVPLDTISNLDNILPSWRNQSGTPGFSATIYDILVLAKVPDQSYGMTCDVVRSAPVPTGANGFIQIGPEEMSYIIDYVRHILCFKLGGSEFQSTVPLFDNFMSGAKQRSTLLSSIARNLNPLFGSAAKQESEVHAA